MSKVSIKNCGYYPSSLFKELNWESTTYYYGIINDIDNSINTLHSSYNKLKQIPHLSPKCEKYVKMRQRRELIVVSDDEKININIKLSTKKGTKLYICI